MSKYWYKKRLIIALLLAVILGGGFFIGEEKKEKEVSVESISDDLLIPGGMPVGIYMETDGVMVLGTEKIKGADGKKYEPAERLVRPGDYILAVNNEHVKNKKELLGKVGKLSGEEAVLKLRREKEIINVRLKPVECEEKGYKFGIWVRDNTQGLGTLTFLTKNSEYGALGHGIHDVDTGELLELSKGRLYETSIRDIQKGKNGKPGGMEGIIVYNNYNILGSIEENSEAGIYGHLERIDKLFQEETPLPAAAKHEIEKGEAVIRCSVDGKVGEYKIRITKIDPNEREVNKGIELEIIDKGLIEKTGGIVQGMSGSPIIQNGKIVGAVTHVFVQDAKKGYGIFIENMLNHVE